MSGGRQLGGMDAMDEGGWGQLDTLGGSVDGLVRKQQHTHHGTSGVRR